MRLLSNDHNQNAGCQRYAPSLSNDPNRVFSDTFNRNSIENRVSNHRRSLLSVNMEPATPIRLLAVANNERGDLFTRLMKDLFFALGYDDLRLDVHKSGRELDIQGKHRLEPRRVVAECKAHDAKIGGDELNKFFGALTRERKNSGFPIAGYFISLGGFTETSIEQENETGDDRVVLLTGEQVVDELERSRVIVNNTQAVERAGRCVEHAGLQDIALDGLELLGHQRGYIWAIFYAKGKHRTHLALVHADGTPLADTVAKEIADQDRQCGGSLHLLHYIVPPIPAQDRDELVRRAIEQYRHWVAEECGYIQLDGLPADTDLSATRLRLESLFVPLKATGIPNKEDHPDLQQTVRDMVFSIGELLGGTPHLVFLAMPGGGKSTLLKRLATAYAFPERRKQIADDLPERDWMPLMLRCRELRDRAHRPILELLDDIARHAGMNREECTAFRDYVHEALRSGEILLLVDGLDEISDESARRTFSCHLRTFIAMFPQTALVITSRQAGFRLVASVVAGVCEELKLSPLDEEDVISLCERWHVEVVGDTQKVRNEAKELGQSIWNNYRLRTLTENPLLLTTLLVVKRCVGELPRSRATLYREAIRVLVRTWNVEGYSPLDEDETLAQLSYVACAMMINGEQQIGQKTLLRLLQEARRELDAELQFARISPQDFIQRIEYRSSLLIQTGHARIDGELQPIFEFRHLTFQEYLAARGYVEEQFPGRDAGKPLAELLQEHFGDDRWREVITLAAILAGRKAEDLMKRLTKACELIESDETGSVEQGRESQLRLLYGCILDEVQVSPSALRGCLRELARQSLDDDEELESARVTSILRGKFSTVFQEVVEQSYLAGDCGFERFASTLELLSVHSWFGGAEPVMSDEVAKSLRVALQGSDRLQRIRAALVSMSLAFKGNLETDRKEASVDVVECFQSLSEGLAAMLSIEDRPSAHAASWALAWIGEHRLLRRLPKPEMLLRLFKVWGSAESTQQAHFAAWALSSQPLLPRDAFVPDVWEDCDTFLQDALNNESYLGRRTQYAAFVVAWYRHSPWSDSELADHIGRCISHAHRYLMRIPPTIRELLEQLDQAGQRAIVDWERNWGERRASRNGHPSCGIFRWPTHHSTGDEVSL